MFCATPELLEKLLLFLYAVSTRNLAEAHDLIFKIFGKAFSWDKLVKRMLLWKTQYVRFILQVMTQQQKDLKQGFLLRL